MSGGQEKTVQNEVVTREKYTDTKLPKLQEICYGCTSGFKGWIYEDVKLETNKTVLGEYTQHVKAFGNFILGVSAEGAMPKVLA